MSLSYLSGERFALIDLGSNSIRLVIFERSRPFAAPLLNEKSVVELGRGMQETGQLAKDRVKAALETFRHFKLLLEGLEIQEIHIVATAAVRDASNADDLLRPIENLLGTEVQILNGEQEAHYAALGVQLHCPGASGLVADLGGGSLELAEISANGVGRCVSLPLGVLRLESQGVDGAQQAMANALRTIPWLRDLKPEDRLYLVGGTWRALAKAHMARKSYPLNVVHRYAVKTKALRKYAHKILTRAPDRLDAMDQVPANRRRKLPWAGLALAALISHTKPKRAVFSGAGLREGFGVKLLGRQGELAMPASDRYDLAIAALIPAGGRFGNPSAELFNWMSPLFGKEKPELADRRAQACQLFDFGWEAHPSYRESDIPSSVLHSATLTQSHKDRAYLAFVLFLRHGGDPKHTAYDDWLKLLDLLPKGHRRHALATGHALRLAHKISRGIIPLVRHTSLEIRDLQLVLTIGNADLGAMKHVYSGALSKLSASLALEPMIQRP